MAKNNDYHLEEMENAAVERNKNLKRAGIVGASVLGAGGTVMYGAEKIHESMAETPTTEDEIDSNEVLAGANAGATELQEETVQPVAQPQAQNVHVYHHIVEEEIVQENTPEVSVEESSLVFDEEGNIISQFDAGTIDGKAFVVVDEDLNGSGDLVAIDANNNGVFEENEISRLDNSTYQMGHGKTANLYIMTEEGQMVNIAPDNGAYPHDSLADIHNDFEDEKTGESYHDDLAENNPDYRNEEGSMYNAGMEDDNDTLYAQENSGYSGEQEIDTLDTYEDFTYNEADDYGTSDIMADDFSSFDDPIA